MKVVRMLAAALLVGLVVGVATAASAGPPSPTDPAGRDHDILGVVPVKNAAAKGGGGSNLVYHGGPVMHANTTYAIYWVPAGYSVSSGYQSLIDGFFQNVAADSGKTSNVYYSDTQYSDGAGPSGYSSQFGDSYLDTSPLPASGCSDPYTSVCLSDAQLRAEIARVIAVRNWPTGSGSVFFLFTAKGIGSCYSGSSCAFSYYCAYHSSFTSNGSPVIYANQPYADTVPAACDAGQHPNGDDADATINVTSHEHNEAITDWQGNAWYDRRGYENGDKCAWTFGTALGSTGTGAYNQVIGSGKYYLQREWSNASSGCVLTGT
jgi:hypothetical protein